MVCFKRVKTELEGFERYNPESDGKTNTIFQADTGKSC